MTAGINESKTLAKDISCECKCRFDGRQCNSNQWWNNNKYWCDCKKTHVCGKDYVWNPATCNCENRKCLASIMNDSAVTRDENVKSFYEETKTIPAYSDEKKVTCKTQYFYVLLAFLLIAITLLIDASIYHFITQDLNNSILIV